MSLLITETQLKLAAIQMGLIIPMNFETTSIEEISMIAYSNIHCDKKIFETWSELVDGYNWLKNNPSENWETELKNDKFGFFNDNINKYIQVFKKHGLIR